MDVEFTQIKVIGFDADDTLWINETYFREAEAQFCELLQQYETKNRIEQELFKIEMDNLPLYGYGIKAFTLSLIECGLDLSGGKLAQKDIQKIIELGKAMMVKPVELIDGVLEVIAKLSKKYRLIVMTKGDLMDQERKLEKSGLYRYFDHVEVLSDKKADNYSRLLHHLEIDLNEFVMIGNSLKSDVLPILELGAQAIHVPFHTTWVHEAVEAPADANYLCVPKLKAILPYFIENGLKCV